MSIISTLSTARLGLAANQRALNIASNNIANVNTPGYSRQAPIFESIGGGGVRIFDVQRLGDSFLNSQFRQSTSRLATRTVLAQNLSLLETALSETDETGISRSIQDFFASLQDLSIQPAGSPERQAVRAQAERMISTLQSASQQIGQIRNQIDQQVRQQVDQVNSLTSALADLNSQITSRQGTGGGLNHIFDQRDQIIAELSTIIGVNVVENENGSVTVFGEGGLTLVEGVESYNLGTLPDSANRGFVRVTYEGITGSGSVIIDNRLTEGSLAGLIQSRDGELIESLNRIQRLSAEMIRSFNAQHQLGFGLDGVTGRDFFTGLDVSALATITNNGGAQPSAASIVDPSLLTFDDYEIRFTSPTLFDVVDVTSGTTLSSGNAYVSGAPITFDGMSVTISDSPGPPAAGDVFEVNSYAGTIERSALSAAVLNDPGAIAAGLTASPGDNENALALAGLRFASVLGDSGSLTFEEFQNETRTRLGLRVQSATSSLVDEEIAQFQVAQLAQAARGVSLDEEAIQIIQYQRAFEASSRVIRVADELMQTLVNLV